VWTSVLVVLILSASTQVITVSGRHHMLRALPGMSLWSP